VFRQIEHELKRSLVRLRHESNSEPRPSMARRLPSEMSHAGMLTSLWTEHEPEYFAAVEHLSDAQLAGFSVDDLREVRVAVSAYGLHLFGKVRIPSLPDEGPAYIHFRAFTGGPDDQATLHSIRRLPPSSKPRPGATPESRRCVADIPHPRYRRQGGTKRGARLSCSFHQG